MTCSFDLEDKRQASIAVISIAVISIAVIIALIILFFRP